MCCQCVANKKHQCVVMTNFIYTEYFGIIKALIEQGLYKQKKWSGKQDLNLQPPGPKPGALPS